MAEQPQHRAGVGKVLVFDLLIFFFLHLLPSAVGQQAGQTCYLAHLLPLKKLPQPP